MLSYEKRLENLLSVSGSLKDYLADLPDESWLKPSACDRWQIADVAAHLVTGADSYFSSVSRGLEGDSSPPVGRMPAGSDAAVSSAERIAKNATGLRERLGDGLIGAYMESDGRLNQLLAGLRSQDRDKSCYHSGSIVPAENFIDLRLNELTVHEWDMRSCLEPEAHLAIQGLPSTVLMFSRSLAAGSVRWAFWPGPRLDAPVRYRFDITDPVPLRADIVVEGDGVGMAEPSENQIHATFRCNTETFVLVMYGRIPLDAAIGDGRLTAEGNRELVCRFNQWFRGI